MADTTVDAFAAVTLHVKNVRAGPIWIDTDTAYVFYIDQNNVPAYSKTTDGGANWDSPTTLGIFTTSKMSVWCDGWTPGDSGTIIHIAWSDNAQHDIKYRTLDTDDDSLGTERTVFSGASFENGNWSAEMIDITKARGGNLYIGFWGDNDGEFGFYRSTDAGVNWTSRAQLANGNTPDHILLMPGDEADNQDIWCVYWQGFSGFPFSTLYLRIYDNSGDSWSSTAIASAMNAPVNYFQMSAAPRHSDNHVILAARNLLNTSTADLKVWDIGGSGSITAKTDIITDQAETAGVAVFIDQQTDDIYVAYMKGGTWESTVDVFYKKSTDGGGTWGSEQTYSEAAADDIRAVWAGISVGDAGGKFQPVFFNDDLNDLFVNVNNDVDIAGPAIPNRIYQVGQVVSPVALAMPIMRTIPLVAVAGFPHSQIVST